MADATTETDLLSGTSEGNPTDDKGSGAGDQLLGDDTSPDAAADSTTGDSPVQIPKWHEMLPDGLKGDPSLVKFPEFGDMAQGYKDLEGKQGSMITIPGESAGDEDWNGVYAQLGRPDSPADYALGQEKLPDGAEVDAQMAADFEAAAHANGLTTKQAKAMYGHLGKVAAGAVAKNSQRMKAKKAESELVLRREHPTDYNEFMATVQQGWKSLGKELQSFITRSGYGNEVAFINHCAKQGKMYAEDRFVEGDGPGAPANDGGVEFSYPGLDI